MFTAHILSSKYTFLFSHEIELQTHCRVGVILAPNCANGKTHSYKSKIDFLLQECTTPRATQVQDNNENNPPLTYAGDAAASNVPPSPKIIHPTVRIYPLHPKQKILQMDNKKLHVKIK